MMKRSMPIFFIIISICYFFYVQGLGSSSMIGDDGNGDPGNQLLPTIVSIVMFISSVTMLLKNENENIRRVTEGRIFYITLIYSVLYILLFRFVGFLLLTNFLLLSLTIFYSIQFKKEHLSKYFISIILSSSVLILFYAICRYLKRWMSLTGREMSIDLLKSPMVIFFTSLLVIFTLSWVLSRPYKVLTRKIFSNKSSMTVLNVFPLSMNISIYTSLILYLVFKQLFNVNLLRGLLWF